MTARNPPPPRPDARKQRKIRNPPCTTSGRMMAKAFEDEIRKLSTERSEAIQALADHAQYVAKREVALRALPAVASNSPHRVIAKQLWRLCQREAGKLDDMILKLCGAVAADEVLLP